VQALAPDPTDGSASRAGDDSHLLARVRAGTVVRLEDLPPDAALKRLEYRALDGRVLATILGGK
jgi:hypothetical protein